MGRETKNTTSLDVAAAYEAIVGLGDSRGLGERATRMRRDFQRRTGSFGPEDPWFETRARAFWDDALAAQGFATAAAAYLGEDEQAVAECLARAHRGFFIVDEVDDRGACLLDMWSGAEFIVRYLDETQALTLEHAEGGMDARVIGCRSGPDLYVLPGAYHHAPNTLEPALDILAAAQQRGMSTQEALDALLRMDLVFRSSSRVKAAFAYRVEGLTLRHA